MSAFLISSFRRVQNVVCFLLRDSPASDLYMPTFRNTLSVPSSKAGVKMPLKMEQIECSETSAYINQTPGNHLNECNVQKLYNFDVDISSILPVYIYIYTYQIIRQYLSNDE